MSTCPSATIASPIRHEPLLSLRLLVISKVLDATLLHVVNSWPLRHTRDDGEITLELPEHVLILETLLLFLGTDDCEKTTSNTDHTKKTYKSYR